MQRQVETRLSPEDRAESDRLRLLARDAVVTRAELHAQRRRLLETSRQDLLRMLEQRISAPR